MPDRTTTWPLSQYGTWVSTQRKRLRMVTSPKTLTSSGGGHAGQVTQRVGCLRTVQVARLEVEDAGDVGLASRGRKGVDGHDLGARLAQAQDELDEVGLGTAADADPAQYGAGPGKLKVR